MARNSIWSSTSRIVFISISSCWGGRNLQRGVKGDSGILSAVSAICSRPVSRDHLSSIDAQELHVEHQRGIGRDHASRSGFTVGEVRREHKLTPPADPHTRYSFVPPRNDLTGTQ